MYTTVLAVNPIWILRPRVDFVWHCHTKYQSLYIYIYIYIYGIYI